MNRLPIHVQAIEAPRCLEAVAAVWLAWQSARDQNIQERRDLFPWITERFVFFSLALGAAGTIALAFLSEVPTVGTALHLVSSWLKVGLIAAVILYKKDKKVH